MMLVAALKADDDEPATDLEGAGGFIAGQEYDDDDDDELEHGESYAPTCKPRRLGF